MYRKHLSLFWLSNRRCCIRHDLQYPHYFAGDWEEGRLRDAASPGEDSDEEALGDFEDMESGQKYGADGDIATATALKAIQDETKAMRSDKAAKKATFDSEYDVGRLLNCHP